ncbi:hypothetical protein [Nannocystis pusilla]|uniref:hypothetical protein n=1 Tax=Nannocystis pusilla TaxID=889268 RepID=UPI003B8163F3
MRAGTWDLVRRRVYLWTLTLTAIAAGSAAALAGAEQAWSVVAGALIGFINLGSLARAVVRLVAEVQADPQRGPAGPAESVLHWCAGRSLLLRPSPSFGTCPADLRGSQQGSWRPWSPSAWRLSRAAPTSPATIPNRTPEHG